MDKFLLAENPMRPEDSGIWIIHLLDPIAIIKCTEGHNLSDSSGIIYKHYEYKNTDGVIELWTLQIHYISNNYQQVNLLNRAWRWYRAYMEWEDNNIDIEQLGQNN